MSAVATAKSPIFWILFTNPLCVTAHPVGTDECDTSCGVPLKKHLLELQPPPTFNLVCDATCADEECLPPDILGPQKSLLVSGRCEKLLTSIGINNLEFKKVRVDVVSPHRFKQTCPEYFLLNIIGLVPVVEIEKSKILQWGKRRQSILEMESLAFKLDNLNGQKIIRSSEMPQMIIVADEVKKAFVAAGITGCLMIRDVEWKPGMI